MALKIQKVVVVEPVEVHASWCSDRNRRNCHLGAYPDSECKVVLAKFTVFVEDWSCVGEVAGRPMKADWEDRCYQVAKEVRSKLEGVLTIRE